MISVNVFRPPGHVERLTPKHGMDKITPSISPQTTDRPDPMDEKKYVVVTVSGKDRPGLLASFTGILIDNNVDIVDIDQTALHDFLALSILLDLGKSNREKDSVLKDLLFEANRLGMRLNFQLLSERELPDKHAKNLFVLTLFGGTRALAAIAGVLGDQVANVEKITNLGFRSAHCIELTIDVSNTPSLSKLKERLLAKSHELDIDLAVQKAQAYRKSKRLAFFDMDRTLVDTEAIDEMARVAGVYREVSRVTEKAMRGDLDFEDSLRQRTALLKGLTLEQLEGIRKDLALSDGAAELVGTLKNRGYAVGVVSGGFGFFADSLKDHLGLDFAFANKLDIKDGVLTGKIKGDIVDDAAKAKIVNTVAAEMGIHLDQTVAIGDGANDKLMLGQAGLGIAYNAHAGVARSAVMSVGRNRLMNILYTLGITEEDILGGEE